MNFIFELIFRRRMSISGLFGGENFDDLLRSDWYGIEASRDNKLGTPVHRLPLFSRCPITNEARLESPVVSFLSLHHVFKYEYVSPLYILNLNNLKL